jgi:hypothetical protein
MITVRVTAADHARLAAEAARTGLSLSGLAERLVTKGRIIVPPSTIPAPLHPALLAELKRVGNNLNQIAHAANAGLPPNHLMAAGALHDLITLLAKDELLSQRLNALRTRTTANDSAPPSTRHEFQRSVQLRPARSGQSE